MMKALPARTAREFRQQVVDVIAGFKAYDVPGLCSRLGLAEGTSDEAFSSKFKYAHSRLQRMSVTGLIKVARALLEETESAELSEFLARIDDLDAPPITELTRRRLMSVFNGRPLASQIDQMELIKRVWPIASMPSKFGSGTLEDDIFQATVRNDDWDNSELLTALGFLSCSHARLSAFLEEVTSPLAQTQDEQPVLAAALNVHLKHDGYRLAVVGKISGSPIYEMQRASIGSPADQAISASLAAFNPDEIHGRWTAAVDRCADDPCGAITLARTLLEDVCKWVIDEAGNTFAEKDDLPALYRKLAKILRLAPDDHTEQSFKQLLGSCQQIVGLLGSLRNKLGDAHSPGPKRVKPAPRHAQLAVTLSGGMATFLVETWKARQEESIKPTQQR